MGRIAARFQGLPLFRVVGIARDRINRVRWGSEAPLFAEQISVDPRDCIFSLRLGSQTWSSGRVVRDKKIFEYRMRTLDEPVISACLRHWKEGLGWEETGIFDALYENVQKFGVYDGCRSMEDIVDRYARLDAVYAMVARERRLRCRDDVDPSGWREMNGILVHVGLDGELFFGGNGNHRLAMALALELDVIPAQLGTVHCSAIPLLKAIRAAPNGYANE